MDIARMLDRRRHPFYKHSEAAFFLARDTDGQPCGRIAVLNNRNYNRFNSEHTGFFYLFECVEDADTARALFAAAEDWCRCRGLNKVIGPKGFTALDGMGLLVRGFEHRPALGIPYNHSYYPALLEAAGYSGRADTVSGYVSSSMRLPEKVHQMADLIKRKRGLHVPHFRSRRDLLSIVPKIQAMYNAALPGTTGNVPLTDDEVQTMAQQLSLFADPRLIKILMKGDDPVGFLFCYPDISAALQRSNGRLIPFGWLDAFIELRRTKWLNINGAGIVEKYRGLGGTAILFSEMEKSILEGNFDHAEVVQIGTDNDRMLRELRDLGIDFYKAHRVYERAI
jgi:GNAT superfamily N-acetyltransferase